MQILIGFIGIVALLLLGYLIYVLFKGDEMQ